MPIDEIIDRTAFAGLLDSLGAVVFAARCKELDRLANTGALAGAKTRCEAIGTERARGPW